MCAPASNVNNSTFVFCNQWSMDVWSVEMFDQQTGSPLSTLCLITKTKVLLLCLSFVEGTLMQMLQARHTTMKELALIYLTKVVFFVL